MWVVSFRFVNAVPPPNARCSLLLLLLLHMMKEMICAKRFQEAAIGQKPSKALKAQRKVHGCKTLHTISVYVYMGLDTHTHRYHGI